MLGVELSKASKQLVEALGVSTSWWTLRAFHLMLEALLSFFQMKEFFLRSFTPMGCPAVSRGLWSLPSNLHVGETSLVVAWNLRFSGFGLF